jgi:hypothetical protein
LSVLEEPVEEIAVRLLYRHLCHMQRTIGVDQNLLGAGNAGWLIVGSAPAGRRADQMPLLVRQESTR